ncbi:O-antigen ligase domain-containing protein, partial [Paenibacillus lemnae]|nr:O-antigen ligase domain-containing protein [Paenibacillus lemnae]
MAVRGVLFGMLLLLMGMSCTQTGLFFDSDLYAISAVWGGGCLLILAVCIRDSRRMEMIRNHLCWSGSYPLMGLSILMIGIYSVHACTGPVSMEGTLQEWISWSLYGSAGLAAWLLGGEARGRQLVMCLWHAAGVLLCGSALLAVYGLLDLPHVVMRVADPAVSASGARLGGLLQYPNTFGAVMAAFLLERLFALPAALRRRAGRLRAAAALLPLAPYTAALLLTESRGAWLAAALACAAGLAAERRCAALLLAACAAPVASAALLYGQLTEVQLAPAVLPGLLWLAGLWAGGVIAGQWMARAAGSGLGLAAAGRARMR